MRLVRNPRLLLAAAFATSAASASCHDYQQGYYSACDEPAGLAIDCPTAPERDPDFTAWDACSKLAACGVIVTDEPDNDGGNDSQFGFERCVNIVEDAADEQGNVLFACIELSSCTELSQTDPPEIEGDPDPHPDRDNVERVVGWCGRLQPP